MTFSTGRLCEKIYHPLNSHSLTSSKSSLLEPIAKDLLDEDVQSDVDAVDLESFATAADDDADDDTLQPEAVASVEPIILPSIEELTKNVQNLIDKDNADVVESDKAALAPKEEVTEATFEAGGLENVEEEPLPINNQDNDDSGHDLKKDSNNLKICSTNDGDGDVAIVLCEFYKRVFTYIF